MFNVFDKIEIETKHEHAVIQPQTPLQSVRIIALQDLALHDVVVNALEVIVIGHHTIYVFDRSLHFDRELILVDFAGKRDFGTPLSYPRAGR